MKTHILKILFLCGLVYIPPVLWGATPEILEIGPEESAGGVGRLVNIATDSKNQPHIITDVGGSNLSYFYDKIGANWHPYKFDSGGESHQSYNPHIEINKYNQAWYSVVKWWSHGMGMMIRNNMSTAPSGVLKYTATSGGTGGLPVSNLSLDINSNNRCVVYGGNGGWYEKVNWNGSSYTSGGKGTLDTGRGGEKNYFWISRAGNFLHPNGENHPVWHSCSDWSYNNSVRKAAGKLPVSWIGSAYYAYSGDDGCYPMVIGDNNEPQTAYLFTDYKQFGGPGVMLQIWKGDNNAGDGHFVFGTGSLLNVDPSGTSGMRRYEPQLAPAKEGGAWACYTANGHIRIRYIPSNIKSSAGLGKIIEFPGYRGAIAVDNKGNLHVAYINGGVKYRKLTIAGTTDSIPTTAGDFNGDGIDDLATFDPASFKWYIMDGVDKEKPALVFGAQWGFPGAIPVVGNFVSDADEKTPKDDVGAYSPKSGIWHIRSGISGSTKEVHWGYPNTIPVPADYNGDGMDDFAVYDTQTGAWHIMGANGTLVDISDIWGGFETAVPVPGDYDNDGYADLAIYNSADGKWYIRTTQRFLMYDMRLGAPGMMITSGDYNGDGISDPAVYNPAEGKWYITKGGTSGEPLYWGVQWGSPTMIPVPGDYDGDGIDDLALYDEAAGKWYIRQTKSGGTVILWAEAWGGSGLTPVSGDYDGDGKADLALYNQRYGLWYIKSATKGGESILWEEAWGGPGLTAVAGDYDGDGKADLAIYQQAKGLWYIKPAQAKQPAFIMGENWGTPTMQPVSGDYNGDGQNDLIVYDTKTGLWYARDNGGKVLMVAGFAGHKGMPVLADYDGDGKGDPTVIDPTSYGWYSKKLPKLLVLGEQWGAPGMVPVPGDFNGGGDDLAVWDKATGNWYVRTLSGQQVAWAKNLGLRGMHPVSGDFNGDGKNDITVWDPIYWENWGQKSPSWYSVSLSPTAGGRIAWGLPWGGANHIAIGARN